MVESAGTAPVSAAAVAHEGCPVATVEVGVGVEASAEPAAVLLEAALEVVLPAAEAATVATAATAGEAKPRAVATSAATGMAEVAARQVRRETAKGIGKFPPQEEADTSAVPAPGLLCRISCAAKSSGSEPDSSPSGGAQMARRMSSELWRPLNQCACNGAVKLMRSWSQSESPPARRDRTGAPTIG
jgi:hypothetical protein